MKAPFTHFVALAALTCPWGYTMADEAFSVKPKKCVTLHKGQTCYQNLDFKWQADNKISCLYAVNTEVPLHCNRQSGSVVFRYEFASDKKQVFTLRDESGNNIATVKVEVASVYKGKRRATTGWRIF